MELFDLMTKFLFQEPKFWLHCGLARVSWLNNDIQAILHKNLEIVMTENNQNQGGQQNQQGGGQKVVAANKVAAANRSLVSSSSSLVSSSRDRSPDRAANKAASRNKRSSSEKRTPGFGRGFLFVGSFAYRARSRHTTIYGMARRQSPIRQRPSPFAPSIRRGNNSEPKTAFSMHSSCRRCYLQRRPNMKLLFLIVLLLTLEGCQGSSRFEGTQIGPFAVSNGLTSSPP